MALRSYPIEELVAFKTNATIFKMLFKEYFNVKSVTIYFNYKLVTVNRWQFGMHKCLIFWLKNPVNMLKINLTCWTL